MVSAIFRYTLVLLVLWGLLGCTSGKDDDDGYLVRVNDFKISEQEVDSQLKLETKLDSNFYVTDDTKTAFIRDLIQTQLLIQEARKRKLDERELFRETIQRYWESTLIRDLLAEKGAEIRKNTVVTEEDLTNYYQANKEFLGDRPFDEIRQELAGKVEDRMVTDRLEAWINSLKKAATIEIRDKELSARLQSGGEN